ncbi:MAG: hypothetical protein GC150_02860 [Rhizobiales bacterium]|nr:hypothetical protein [Hyphomicrobiales bacterium]
MVEVEQRPEGSTGALRSARPIGIGDGLALVALGLGWGLEAALVKTAVEAGLNELAALTVTLAAIAVGFIAITVAAGRTVPFTPRTVRFFLTSGSLGYLGPLVIFFLVADHVDAGLLTLVTSTTPLLTVAGAALLGLEPVTGRTGAAVLLGAAATLLILVPEAALPTPEMASWAAVAVAIPLFYAIDNLYVAHAWPDRIDVLQASTGEVIVATLLILPFALAFGDFTTLTAAAPQVLLALAGLALVMIGGVYLFFHVVRSRGGIFVSFASYFTILAGFAWGYLLFGERPSIWVWASVAAIFLALGVLIERKRRQVPRAEDGEG